MNPLEMVGKAGKGVGQFGAALLRGLHAGPGTRLPAAAEGVRGALCHAACPA